MSTPATIYTDGSVATEGRFKAGAWAIVWQEAGGSFGTRCAAVEHVHSSSEMELRAVIAAVAMVPPGAGATVASDCQSVVEAATALLADGALGSRHQAFPALWRELAALCAGRQVVFRWVKGHGGCVLNGEANRLARETARGAARRLESADRGSRFLRLRAPVPFPAAR